MAAKEMFDYLDAQTADYTTTTLSITPQNVMVEAGTKNQVVHTADDNSEEYISFSNDSIFYVTLQWEILDEADAGTIFDFFHDSTKGNGITRTFYWEHPTDGHKYVVRFAEALPRSISHPEIYGIQQIKLRVTGKYDP